MKRLIWISLISFLLLSCDLFKNKYETPSWIQGTWTNQSDPSDQNYDEWQFTSDNVINTTYTNGMADVFDYSEYGYQEAFTSTTYKLISPLGDDYWDQFTKGSGFIGWEVKQGASMVLDNGILIPN